MNELAARWDAHPGWAGEFTEGDRLIVESLVRFGADRDPEAGSLTDADDPVILALLHLARSLRLEHAALALDETTLVSVLGAGTRTGGAEALRGEARDVIGALRTLPTPLARAVCVHTDLADAVTPHGAPIVVALHEGTPAFVHVRRLAFAESRIADALLAATTDEPWGALADDERAAVARALGDEPAGAVFEHVARHRISIVTGGPGTGKSTAIVRVLAAIAEAHRGARPCSVALCAPTARAAVRLREVLDATVAVDARASGLRVDEGSGSLHHLLGLRPDVAAPTKEVTCDLVVVDEGSMAELEMFDHLLGAVSKDTRVVILGDPDQLASVNVGAALRDIVDAAVNGPLDGLLTELTTNFRSGSAVTQLAAAANAGDADALLAVAASHPGTLTIGPDQRDALAEVRDAMDRLQRAAMADDRSGALAALGGHVVLCATREGEGSVAWWRDQLEPAARHRSGATSGWAPGTPVLVTENESGARGAQRLTNGDVGVVTGAGAEAAVVFGPTAAPRARALSELHRAEAAWALTIHKAQGSEFTDVVISLPARDSPILTRELLYTAITRAKERVRIVATTEAITRALSRRIARVSGLAERITARDARAVSE